jgi:hypothetical protein
MDLIDPNLSFVNLNQINASVQISLKNLISQAIEISNELENSENYLTMEQKLSNEFDKILPNILPISISTFNFTISKSPLHTIFFDYFNIIYTNFEKELIDLRQSNEILSEIFEMLWKNFIRDTLNIYIYISNSFWKNKKKLSPAALRKSKIKVAKSRLLSEAKKTQEMESNITHMEQLSEPTISQRKLYNNMIGIPGLQDVLGKYYI